MLLQEILFYIFSSIAILGALMVISVKNPVYSVLFLILVFFNVSGLLILLNMEFIALTFLIVYIGAIAVLFLFVVMMLNIKKVTLQQSIRSLPISSLIGLVFFFEVYLIIGNDNIPLIVSSTVNHLPTSQYFNLANHIDTYSNIKTIGAVLYTYYGITFIMAGVILLEAMIAAIILTMDSNKATKRQQIFQQISRDFENAIFLTKLTPSVSKNTKDVLTK